MKNCIRAGLFCLLFVFTACSNQTQLTIGNSTGEGFYLIDPQTMRNVTAEKIEKLEKSGEIRRISQSTTEYTYNDKETGKSAFHKFKAGNRYAFCFVSDSALKKAKETNTAPKYKALLTTEDVDFSYLTIGITSVNGNPEFKIMAIY